MKSQSQSFSIDLKDNKYIYIWYLLLHFVCLSWTNIGLVEPPAVLRFIVTLGVFLPLVKYFWMAPAIFILFVGLRFNSVAPFGYIPQSWSVYEYLILFVAILHVAIFKNEKIFSFSRSQILLFVFLFLIDLINIQPFSKMFLFCLMLFMLYNSIQNRKSLNLTVLSFIILTITLSVYYFVFAKEFTAAYFGSHEERATWVDPNYFGVLLGCGVILASAYIYRSINVNLNIVYRILFITCIILGVMVVALQASRGAMLAVAIAMVTQLLFSRTKLYLKFLFLFATIVGVICLFQSDYFNLLITRIEEDGGTGSGRTEIWASKLTEWSENPLNYFGTGYYGSVLYFKPYNFDCHNEYVSIIINYGFIGISILFVSVYKLLCIVRNRAFIWSVAFFVLTAFMTLSPITQQTGWNACPFLILLLYKVIAVDKGYIYKDEA